MSLRPARPALLALFVLSACGATPAARATRGADAPAPAAEATVVAASSNAELAGARCEGAVPGVFCRCRTGDDAESAPPADGQKRFELRLSASGGRMVLDSEVLGHFTVEGPQTRCLYFDLVAGAKSKFSVTAVADDKTKGVLPQFSMAEYGPAGPFWYETLAVECQGKYGQCDRDGADAWQESLAGRKRGRLDPCGSAVVKSLRWDTSGSESSRDGEFFHDFTVTFELEVKKFITRFAPGSTECVPK